MLVSQTFAYFGTAAKKQRLPRHVGRPQPRWLPWLDAAGYAAAAVSLSFAYAPVREALTELLAAYRLGS